MNYLFVSTNNNNILNNAPPPPPPLRLAVNQVIFPQKLIHFCYFQVEALNERKQNPVAPTLYLNMCSFLWDLYWI